MMSPIPFSIHFLGDYALYTVSPEYFKEDCVACENLVVCMRHCKETKANMASVQVLKTVIIV